MNEPLTTENEVRLTDKELADKIRGKLNELCGLMDQMCHRDWNIDPRIYSDDIGRWHAHCSFTKTVSV